MAVAASGSDSPQQTHAITDLYDVEKRSLLIRYPNWLVIVLALAGVAAFAMTGFLGYEPNSAFSQPWALFFWFCALLITLQVSILRDRSLRSRLIATLVVTVVAIIIIYLLKFSKNLPDFIRELLESGTFFRRLIGTSGFYFGVNFLILAIFWVDTIRRWILRRQGKSPFPPPVHLELGPLKIGTREAAGKPQELPSMQELIAGDLLAGALLCLVLAFVFQADFLSSFIHPSTGSITYCTVSWPWGDCLAPGGGINNPPTLHFIDLIQALVYLPLGLLVLALTSTISGLGAIKGVTDRVQELDELDDPNSIPQQPTGAVSASVIETVIDTLRSALDRRLQLLYYNLVIIVRYIAWPVLLLIATYGLSELSFGIQAYLHSPRGLNDILQDALPAVIWGVAAVVGVVFSTALTLFSWRVVDNTFRFLGLVGFIVLLVFWIFSLALWAFNFLLLLTHATAHTPFSPPSVLTLISLLALVIFAVVFFTRNMRRPASAQAPTVVGARTTTNTPESE